MSNTSVNDDLDESSPVDTYALAPEPVARDTLEEERQLIGFVLVYPEAASDDVLAMPGEFLSSDAHQVLWQIATDRAARGLPSDLVAVGRTLRDEHPEYPRLDERATEYAMRYGFGMTGVVLSSLVHEIRFGHIARKTEETLIGAWQRLKQGRPDLAREAMSGLDPDEGIRDPWVTLAEAWKTALEEAKSPAAIVSTPWARLNRDFLNGGLKAREVHIAAGLAGTGKTALAQQFADHAARRGTNVGVFSLEMAEADFARRFMSTSGYLSMSETMRPKLDMTAESYTKVDEVVSSVGGDGDGQVLIVDDGDLTISRLRALARMGVRRHKVGVFIVDYAQLVDHDNPKLDERERIGDVVRQLKKLAKELDVPVLLLVQPNRNAVLQGRKLTMSDMYGSGDLERYAATVILINKVKDQDDEGNEVDSGIVTFDVDKNRYGTTGPVRMLADLSRQRFEEL